MAERILKTQILMRGDTLANWKSNNPVLANRELAVVNIPANSETGFNEPAVMFKVGDGTTAFNSLGWASALAADVYAWAKAATKPSYSANEIDGLAAFIDDAETNTTYKIEKDTTDGHNLKFYHKGKDDENWTLDATITTEDTVYDDTALAGRVTALETLVGNTAVATQIQNAIAALDLDNTYDPKGAAASAAAAAKAELIGQSTDAASADTIYGAKAHADTKVASVAAGNNGITVGGTATAPTVSLRISAKAGNDLTIETGSGEEGLYYKAPAAQTISVVKDATAETGYASTYHVTVDGTNVGAAINIPKDFVIKSASLETVTTADVPYSGAQVGDKYIDLVVNTVDASETATHIYLPVNDLVDVYTQGDGISVSAQNVISVVVDPTSANGLSVSATGIALGLASANANGAMSSSDFSKLAGISAEAKKVEASQTNGNIKIDSVETTVYTLPSTVLDAADVLTFDGGNAAGRA